MTADLNDQESAMAANTVDVTAATTFARPLPNHPLPSISYLGASIAGRPGGRRERLRSFARATHQVIKQEISKYYGPPSPADSESGLRSVASPSWDHRPPLPPRPSRSTSETTSNSSRNGDVADPSMSVDTPKPYCMLLPAYACRTVEGNQWKMRLTGWTYAMPGSSRLDRLFAVAGRTYGGWVASSVDDDHFVRLLNQFRCQTLRSIELNLSVVDTVSAEHVLSRRLSDPSDIYRHRTPLHQKLRDKTQDIISALSINSGDTGRFDETLILDLSHLLDKAHRKVLRLVASFDSSVDSTTHDAYVDLIEPQGVSIISDIDDTIKITNILDGRDAIFQNTFFKKGEPVQGMSAVYRHWADHGVHIHYVSNSPWQVYFNLSDFIRDQNFPPGSMHLRAISAADLIRNKVSQHKMDVISQILEDFPNRKFILVGDSGERDPEVYRQIYNRYPHQIVKIFIHDVSSTRARSADERDVNRTDSFYNMIRKCISRDQVPFLMPPTPASDTSMENGADYFRLHHSSTTTSALMDAIGEADVPEPGKIVEDPGVPLKTKLDLFNDRIAAVSNGLPSGIFTLFSSASQLLKDPVVNAVIHEHTSMAQQAS